MAGKIFGRFKLLRGLHVEAKDDKGKQIILSRGSVFDSKSDLCEKHNSRDSTKFEQVHESVPIKHIRSGSNFTEEAPELSEEVNFEKMTLPELKEFADGEEIDISGLNKKDEILEMIQMSVA